MTITKKDLIQRLDFEKMNQIRKLAGMMDKPRASYPVSGALLVYRAAEAYNQISRDSQITIDQDYVEFIGFSTIRNVRVNTYFPYEDYESGDLTSRELAASRLFAGGSLMSLGAAGCKYTNKDAYCEFVVRDLFGGYRCPRYGYNLKLHPKYLEPIRLELCAKDAGGYWLYKLLRENRENRTES